MTRFAQTKEALLDQIGDLNSEIRSLKSELTVQRALAEERIPADVVEEWQTLAADILWWARGFEAGANRRQRDTLFSVERVRQMREDIFRVARGQDALLTVRRNAAL